MELIYLDKMNMRTKNKNTASQAPIPITIPIRKNNIWVSKPGSGVMKFLRFRDQHLLPIFIYLNTNKKNLGREKVQH